MEFLPEDVFIEQIPSSPPTLSSAQSSTESFTSETVVGTPPPLSSKETARNNIIRELVETERKYVQDLEVMQASHFVFSFIPFLTPSQRYSTALSQSNTIDQDTIHLLFPNLNKLLNFQRKFLIRLESTGEQAWINQRWGIHFTEMASPT